MTYETIDQKTVNKIAQSLGLGAIIARIRDVDISKGTGIIDNHTKCLWTKDGCRITFAIQHGTIIASCDKKPDPECPK